MLLQGTHGDPHALLGAHEVTLDGKRAVVVRIYNPHARSVACILGGTEQRLEAAQFVPGYFECAFATAEQLPLAYRLHFENHYGESWETEDPYAFMPTVGELDRHLLNEGNHTEVYNVLGSHVRELDGVVGTSFALWAPNAARVSVIGDFNRWDGRCHAMRALGASGVWELFIPRLGEGTLYKFELRTRSGALLTKTDPYGFRFELRPANAAVVTRLDGYSWGDGAWMESRASAPLLEKAMNVYEVHLGSWMQAPSRKPRFLTYRELAPRLADYMLDMGYTHVELMPVMEHPYDGSWGYQVTGYYGVTSRYGTPEDFMFFVDHLHQKGLGVIVDWVPAHFPRDAWALGRFDGTALYEHQDPRLGEHKDWGTYIFNYGRPEVKNFLLANAAFWLDRYHVDGLRVDAVASMLYLDYSREAGQWIPNRYGGRENLEAIEFIKQTNMLVHERFKGAITIAEESTSWPMVTRPVYLGGLGFDLKWNMGWMNDFLEYMKLDPIHRRYHHNKLTFAMMYAYSENFMLVLSHDEVVHGKASLQAKMPGDEWRRFANLRAAFAYMYCHPGKKLLFMGGEFGQYQEWWEAESIHWHLLGADFHRKLHQFVRDLNRIYLTEPAMHEVDYSWEGFSWIDVNDHDHSVLSWVRRAKKPDDFLVCLFNFTPVVREGWRLGVPRDGWYAEILNSDGEAYHGSNVGNQGGVEAEAIPSHGHRHSIRVTLPPLGALILKPDPATWSPLALDGEEGSAGEAGDSDPG
jgi:1,4-alpha-glucan branching enzyme